MSNSGIPTRTLTVPRRQPRRLRRRIFSSLAALAIVWLAVAAATGALGEMNDNFDADFYALTADLGFRVADVTLEGRRFTSRGDISQALGVREGNPILGFNPGAARVALEALPQIASAEVERRLPGTISVRLTERAPMAIWQHGQKMMLIDHDGGVLGENQVAEYNILPMVVGDNAAKPAAVILDLVAHEPELAKRVTAYIRVGDRRWNLRLDNNVEIRLPESDTAAALHKLAGIEAQHGLFERDVIGVDLRMPGKVVVETSQPRDPKRKTSAQQGI